MQEPMRELMPNVLQSPESDTEHETKDLSALRGGSGSPPRWRQRRIVVVAVVLVALALLVPLAVALINLHARVTYQTTTTRSDNLAVNVKAAGALQSAIYNLNFSGAGKIASIDVAVGDQVTSGQTLATLDATSLRDAMAQAQAAVDSATTNLDNTTTNQDSVQAQTQAQVAAAQAQEQSALAACQNPPQGVTPSPNCEQVARSQMYAVQAQADTQNAAAQAQVSAAQAQLKAAQAQLTTAQHNLDNLTLTAPHAGTVAAINGSVGGAPGAAVANSNGSPAPAPGSGTFITLVDLSSSQVVASVDEVNVVSMKAGQPAAFTLRAYPARLFRGAVVAVSPLAQSTSNRVTYPVIIDVDMQSAQRVSLLPGMAASVTITAAQRYNVIVIPTTAISYAHSQAAGASTGNTVVTARAARTARAEAQQLLAQLQASGADVTSDNPTADIVLVRVKGQLVIKPVVLGLTDGKNYEVLAGLSAGEQVVTGAHAG